MFITINEAARLLGKSEHEVFQLSSPCGGPISAVNGGKQFLRSDVEAFISGKVFPLAAEQWLEPYADGCFSESVTAENSPIIRDVLLCGNHSRNGYAIPESAFGGEAHARKLYERQPVFIDHEQGKELSRSVRDMAATVVNVRMRGGRPYADLDTEGHIQGPTLLSLARKRPPHVGLSHVAAYRWSRDRKTVERVEQIMSVDVVFRPATTSGFYEESHPPMVTQPEAVAMSYMPGTGPGLAIGGGL